MCWCYLSSVLERLATGDEKLAPTRALDIAAGHKCQNLDLVTHWTDQIGFKATEMYDGFLRCNVFC
jgi:hypothetical protein